MSSVMGGVAPGLSVLGVGLAITVLLTVGALARSRARPRDKAARSRHAGEDTPQAILYRRYMAGEISEDQYLRLMDGLPYRASGKMSTRLYLN